jgi:hypothetical protein
MMIVMEEAPSVLQQRSRGQFFENPTLGLNRKQKADDTPNREDSSENNEYVGDAIISNHPSDHQGSGG